MPLLRIVVLALLPAISLVASALVYNHHSQEFTLASHEVIGVAVAIAALGAFIGILIGVGADNLWARLLIFMTLVVCVAALLVIPVAIRNHDSATPLAVAHAAELLLWSGTFVVSVVVAAFMENTVISDN